MGSKGAKGAREFEGSEGKGDFPTELVWVDSGLCTTPKSEAAGGRSAEARIHRGELEGGKGAKESAMLKGAAGAIEVQLRKGSDLFEEFWNTNFR